MLESVMLIGMGGIGSNLYRPMVRLLGKIQIIVVDGDKYEEKNKERQECIKQTMGVEKVYMEGGCKGKGVVRIKEYVDEEVIEKLLKSMKRPGLVIVATDNNATRKITLEGIDKDEEGELYWISPANGLDNVQISVYHRVKGKEKLPHPMERYNNIKEPEDHVPGKGCIELAKSEPQLLRTNMITAALTLSLIHDIMIGAGLPAELNYSCKEYNGQALI